MLTNQLPRKWSPSSILGVSQEHMFLENYSTSKNYKKAFDCVNHERLWVILMGMGVPVHLIVLLKRLYTNQEATVRTEFGETDNIYIGSATGMSVSSHHCY